MFPRVQSGHKLDYTVKGLRFVGGHGTQMDGYSQAYLSGRAVSQEQSLMSDLQKITTCSFALMLPLSSTITATSSRRQLSAELLASMSASCGIMLLGCISLADVSWRRFKMGLMHLPKNSDW